MTVVAAIGAITDAAIKIAKLSFAQDVTNAELAKIDAELQQIDLQLDVISQKLDLVLTALAELSVKITAEFDSLYRTPVHTAIAEVNQHFKTWATNWNPGQNPAVPKPEDVFEKLHTATFSLMERNAFANYAMVILAMAYERALLRLPPLHSANSDDERKGFATYNAYFNRALNPTEQGSIANRKADLESYKQSIVNDVQTREPLLCDTGVHEQVVFGPVEGAYGTIGWAEVLHVVSGNLDDGFTDTLQKQYIYIAGNSYGFVGQQKPVTFLPLSTRRDSCLPASICYEVNI